MPRIFFLTGSLCASLFLFSWMSSPGSRGERHHRESASRAAYPDTLKVEANYTNFCAGCHGEKMDAFVDRVWKHGNSPKDLFKAIKTGYPDEGMPGFDSAFNDVEINELSDYILTGIEKVKRYQFQDTKVQENLFPADAMNIRLDTVARGLKSPWSIAFLPGGKFLVTDKFGKLYVVNADHSLDSVSGVPPVLSDGQGGLMDVVLHPGFRQNHLVYLTYSTFKDSAGAVYSTTALMRARLEGLQLLDKKQLFEAHPFSKTRHHYGSRMVFDRAGYLYFSVGERGNEKENPQTLTNDLGKIHRIKDDGTIPSDNPFVNTPGARPSIWSYGHRNPQGLVMHPVTGELWEHEHGPRGGDEINVIKKAANYGWPVITYGINYNGKVMSPISRKEGMEQPVKYWIPSIGPSGITFVQGKKYKGWEGNLLTGSLRFKYLNRSRLSAGVVSHEEILLKNIGRLRDVRMGPDGYLYVSVENPGYVFRLLPVRK